MNRLWQATLSSIDGIAWALRRETAFQQEFAVLVLAIPVSFLIAKDVWMQAVLIASILFVIAIEALNTALEKLSDHVTPERNPMIKVVKDLGSAAVLFAIAIAGLFWLAAFAAYLR